MSDELLRIERERRAGCVVLALCGEVDLSNIDELQREVDVAISGSTHVVIDLSEVEYMDSQGLRLLTQLSKRFSGDDAKLQLIAPPGSVARGVLELTLISQDLEVLDAAAG